MQKKKTDAPQKKQESPISAYLTNYKGIFTGAVALTSGINTLLHTWDIFNTNEEDGYGARYHYFSIALLSAFISTKAYQSSKKSWKAL